jgi:hypothetical protein
MGMQPTRVNENHPRRHPREGGGSIFGLEHNGFPLTRE